MYYESLWNHVVIQQGVFIRLKITSYIASSMNNSWKIHEISDFSDSQFLEKTQKLKVTTLVNVILSKKPL